MVLTGVQTRRGLPSDNGPAINLYARTTVQSLHAGVLFRLRWQYIVQREDWSQEAYINRHSPDLDRRSHSNSRILASSIYCRKNRVWNGNRTEHVCDPSVAGRDPSS